MNFYPRHARPKNHFSLEYRLRRYARRDASRGKITDFIREEGLLEADYVDELVENAPLEIMRNQERHRAGIEIPSWHDFLEQFTPEDAEDDVECDAVAGTSIRLAPSFEAMPEETE